MHTTICVLRAGMPAQFVYVNTAEREHTDLKVEQARRLLTSFIFLVTSVCLCVLRHSYQSAMLSVTRKNTYDE